VSRHTHDQLVAFVESIWKLHPPPDINLAVVATIIDDEKGGGSISTEARASELTVEAIEELIAGGPDRYLVGAISHHRIAETREWVVTTNHALTHPDDPDWPEFCLAIVDGVATERLRNLGITSKGRLRRPS